MEDALRKVLDLLPDELERICHLYEKDSDFKLLCRDYSDALNVVQLWQQSNKTQAPHRVAEYQSMVGELQEDIMHFLQKSNYK